MPHLCVRHVTKRYREVVLRDVSFDVEGGPLVTITGENGAGKTTLLACLLGLVRCRGTLRLDGAPLHSAPRRAAVAFDDTPLRSGLTGADNLRALTGYRGSRAALLRAGAPFLDETHLRRPVRTYSSGQRKRLTLAAIALSDAPLVVLDEPANGLDADGLAVLDRLIASRRAAGHAVIVTGHPPTTDVGPVDTSYVLHGGVLTRQSRSLPAPKRAS